MEKIEEEPTSATLREIENSGGVLLKDIARITNLSITTVSRALRNMPDVGEKTKSKVQELARRLNYHPNEVARNLVLRKTHTFGLSLPGLDNPLYGTLAQQIEKEVEKVGYSLLLSIDSTPFVKTLEFVRKQKTDGFILGPVLTASHLPCLKELKQIKTPFVIFGNTERIDANSVTIDREKGVYEALKSLIALGHKNFACLGLSDRDIFHPTKMRGFQRAIMEYDLKVKPEWLIEGVETIRGGYLKTKELLKEQEIPTVVFCHSDLAAIGALRAINEKGLRVPSDISVLGFDDIEMSEFTNPPLTTIRQPLSKIAFELVRILLEKVKNPDKKPENVILVPEFIIRGSVGPNKKGPHHFTDEAPFK